MKPGLIFALAAIAGVTLPQARPRQPTQRTDVDYERLAAAQAKRWRKVERYTNTPQARARLAESEAETKDWIPIPPPDPEIVAMSEAP